MIRWATRTLALAALFAMAAFGGTIDFALPGTGGFNFDFTVANNDGFDITKITFDMSATQSNAAGNPPLTDGGVSVTSPPPGGSATYFSVNPNVFGFDFTSFNTGEQFLFNMDPDIASDGSYGAVHSEFVGTLVTIVTTGGTVQGSFGTLINPNGARYVGASVDSPVPEPATYALFGVGLAGLALMRRRRA